MDKRLNSTLIAGSALLLASAAIAQEPAQTQTSDRAQTPPSQTQASDQSTSAAQPGAQDRTRTAQAPAQQTPQTQSSSAQKQDSQSRSATGDSSSSSQSMRQARASDAPHPVMMMVLVPVAMESRTDNTLANGCWAKLYGGKDYTGDSFTVVGPLDLADMVGPFGVDWDDKVSSIKAGPKATLTLYDNENFRDKSAKIAAGQQVAHLTEKLGFLEEVESMRINCGASGASSG